MTITINCSAESNKVAILYSDVMLEHRTGENHPEKPERLSSAVSAVKKNNMPNNIIKPTLKGLSELGGEYKGFLYAGLMIVNNEPYLIEYNVRMGDPECQTILPMLKTDIADIFLACCDKKLKNILRNFYSSKFRTGNGKKM